MTAAAVLQFEMGRGDLPAVIFAADQTDCGNPHIFKEDGVLVAVLTSSSAAAQQFHRLDSDARQARINHEPTQVLVALSVGICHRERPHPVSAVSAADKDFLAVKHV